MALNSQPFCETFLLKQLVLLISSVPCVYICSLQVKVTFASFFVLFSFGERHFVTVHIVVTSLNICSAVHFLLHL